MIFSSVVKTPIGNLLIEATGEFITRTTFITDSIEERPNALTRLAVLQFTEYFNGTRKSFHLKVKPAGTAFQQTVWKLISDIPLGKMESYMQLTKRYGDPLAIRAVAAANGKNPLAILVPCHRVVGSDGALTGYAWGLDKKKWLLQHEGAIGKELF